jgi:hypothetical protein
VADGSAQLALPGLVGFDGRQVDQDPERPPRVDLARAADEVGFRIAVEIAFGKRRRVEGVEELPTSWTLTSMVTRSACPVGRAPGRGPSQLLQADLRSVKLVDQILVAKFDRQRSSRRPEHWLAENSAGRFDRSQCSLSSNVHCRPMFTVVGPVE